MFTSVQPVSSGLKPAIVMQVIYREYRVGLPWELLYADDLVVIGDSKEKVISKPNFWMDVLEMKGLRENLSETS